MSTGRVRQHETAAWVVSAVIVVVCALNEFSHSLNGDAHWILTMAGRVLHGERLYRDILEINPPLIIWLQIPAVWFARLLSASPADVFRVIVFAAATASSLVTQRLLARTRFGADTSAARWTLPVLLFTLLVLPGGAFGQREEIITILLLPYLAIQARRVELHPPGNRAATWAGVAAGVAIAIKPHFIAVWVLLAGYQAIGSKRIRPAPEDVAITATGAVYIAAVVVFTPGFFVVVRTFGATYLTFATRTPGDILESAAVVWYCAALLAWAVASLHRGRDGVGSVLVLAGGASILAVLLQGKGWTYQFLPAVCFAMLLGARSLRFARVEPASRPMRYSRLIAAVVLLMSWVPLGHQVAEHLDPRRGRGDRAGDPEVEGLAAATARQRGAHSILVLSADMTSALPWISDLGLESRIRFPYLWVPTAVYQPRRHPAGVVPHRPGEMTAPERAAFDAVVAGVCRADPDLLAVETPERNAQLLGTRAGFDHLRYYSADPRFALTLEKYRQVATVPGFVLYRRQRPGTAPPVAEGGRRDGD